MAQTVTRTDRIQIQVTLSSYTVREPGQKGQEMGAIIETIDQIAEGTDIAASNVAIAGDREAYALTLALRAPC